MKKDDDKTPTSFSHEKDLKSWLENFNESNPNPSLTYSQEHLTALMRQKVSHNKEDRRLQDLEYANKVQDKEFKRRIFDWVQKIVTCYLLFMAIVVLWHTKLELSDAVMIALLTTTTINIIGLPALIIHSLFPKGKKDEEFKIE